MRSVDYLLESLTAIAKIATLGSIPAFSDSVDSEGRQTKQCKIKHFKNQANLALKNYTKLTGIRLLLFPNDIYFYCCKFLVC
jgi:hypothetical protein